MHRSVAVSVVPDWLIAGVTILLFIALLLLFWTRLLKRIVNRRTAQLQRSKTRYQSLYDNSPDMYASVSPDDGKIQECNETLLQNTGYTKEEVIESPIFKMYHEDCIDEVKKAFQQFIETGIIKNKELTLKRKDGSKIDVSLNANEVKNDSGGRLYSISTWRDISDRKKNEKEIEIKSRELENQLIKSEKHRIANLVILKDLNKITKDLKSEINERIQTEKLLNQKMSELEIFNDAAVDREIAINDLRKEINELLVKAGKEEKYEIVE
jgi:PAS domain S-box-containing protein